MTSLASSTAKNGHELPKFAQGSAPRVSLTKSDAAYAEIRARILSCDLAPGAVIDQEMFAAWLGSSTTPVREALRRLEAEQLVVLRAHSEVRVAPASAHEFREFHAIRMGLEPLAAEAAAKTASDDVIETLRAFVTQGAVKKHASEIDLQSSRMFHRTIYTAAGNHTMTQILDSIWDRVGRYRVMLAEVGSVSACDSPEHQAIVKAIEARDGKAVRKLIRTDLETSYKRLLPALETILGKDS
ncbi:GntR family transcriptional regulator [Glaciibacter sp. 2TAF33]|uniref:GntR family transcriptional regulator n=1 Tax=Glaciibacter sp. 2TAF33 TaxID=3233015 RepID=UPI003F91F85E